MTRRITVTEITEFVDASSELIELTDPFTKMEGIVDVSLGSTGSQTLIIFSRAQ